MQKIRTQAVIIAGLFLLAGLVLGQLIAGESATAQQGPRQWRECFSASLWHHDGTHMANPGFRPNTVPVPPGWVPVGGGGPRGESFAVVLCR